MNSKNSTISKIAYFFLSISYGYFVINLVQIDLNNNSGDINEYLDYFINYIDLSYFNSINNTFFNDYIFRYLIFKINDLYNFDYLIILKFFAFITSSIVFFIFIQRVLQSNYSNYLLILFLMVFFSPNVFDLFASGIRSGISFTTTLIAFVYLKGVFKIIVFLFSMWMHLSMIPVIGLYYLFYIINNRFVKSQVLISVLILLIYAAFINLATITFYRIIESALSVRYELLIFYISLIYLFLTKETTKNLYGFISIGLVFILLIGLVLDISFIRYLGYSIILYLLYLTQNNNVNAIKLSTLFYIPFFSLTLFYSISNLL